MGHASSTLRTHCGMYWSATAIGHLLTLPKGTFGLTVLMLTVCQCLNIAICPHGCQLTGTRRALAFVHACCSDCIARLALHDDCIISMDEDISGSMPLCGLELCRGPLSMSSIQFSGTLTSHFQHHLDAVSCGMYGIPMRAHMSMRRFRPALSIPPSGSSCTIRVFAPIGAQYSVFPCFSLCNCCV